MCGKPNPCNILWLEDEPGIVQVIEAYDAEFPAEGMVNFYASSIEEAGKVLSEKEIIIIMVDLNLLDSMGVETVEKIAAIIKEKEAEEVPQIYVYTGLGDGKIVNLAKAYGAREVFFKGEMTVQNAIIFAHHAANEERKTRTVTTERDAYKKEKETLELELKNLKADFNNLAQLIPDQPRIETVEKVGERIENVEKVGKRIEKIHSLVAVN